MITIQDFKKVELIVAVVRSVENHPNADKLFILRVDTGEGGERQLVAGIKGHYTPQELLGKRIIIVSNLAPATLRGAESQGMLLAAQDGEKLAILTTDKDVKPGARVG
ncbi:MAG TPA: methionine--tRNA ligase subunit beta [Candidatus Hypogeohydataceae bacterium YC41]